MSASDLQLTLEEKATNFETMRHIERVRNLLNGFIREILDRAEKHDSSKLEPPEVGGFTQHTHKLAALTYGSQEYDDNKKLLKATLDHHYARNRHHPEFHKNGIEDMNLIDLLELLADWKSASERHDNGCINHSIDKNAERFGFSVQLKKIFENSIDLLS